LRLPTDFLITAVNRDMAKISETRYQSDTDVLRKRNRSGRFAAKLGMANTFQKSGARLFASSTDFSQVPQRAPSIIVHAVRTTNNLETYLDHTDITFDWVARLENRKPEAVKKKGTAHEHIC
jgi:predicted alpha-1,6-mannanase (GH76 family)